jgi:hypothetical protein
MCELSTVAGGALAWIMLRDLRHTAELTWRFPASRTPGAPRENSVGIR